MLPIELDIENFYCHTKSIINFNDFRAAVIVGKINGNDKYSNGAGKSTIFAAIKYAIFNETDTSSIEKIIKHDAENCKISYTFQCSIDNEIYKIIRYRGRKSGSEVRLFKKVNDDWLDLTQRTSTETEKEIYKLIKINYRTFTNSVLFAQGDIAGIASMTPRERKNALKEALQLGVYSKYEAAIKKKVSDLTKEVDKNKTILSTLGDPENDIINFKNKLTNILPIKLNVENNLFEVEKKHNLLSKEIDINQNLINDFLEKINLSKSSLLIIDKEIFVLSKEIEKFDLRIKEILNQETDGLSKAKILFKQIKELKSLKLRSYDDIKNDITSIRDNLLEKQSDYKQLISKLKDLQIPLTSEDICKNCRQPVDQSSRKNCQKTIDDEIFNVEANLSKLKDIIKHLQLQQENLIKEQDENHKYQLSLQNKENDLEKEKKNITSAYSLIKEFEALKFDKEKEFAIKEKIKFDLIDKQKESHFSNEAIRINSILKDLKDNLSLLIVEKNTLNKKALEVSNEQAILLHKIEQKEIDILNIKNIKNTLNDLEYQFAIHQKVMTAFGSGGIPALITYNILDDFQISSNMILDQLRPGLRLQFITEKDKKDDTVSDTLDITYFLNNTELEYSQLSGAQKLLASLSLRLGLASIIRKRLGIDLKMILIDEADQSLDEGALETFEQAIKQLQSDYKILLITHNQDLKVKFNHAIIVEQDLNLNSTAKLVEGW